MQEVVTSLDKAKTTDVQAIDKKQNIAEATEAANVKAAVDATLVTKVSTPTVEYTPNDNRFAKFADVTKYQVLQTWEIGGSNPQFWKGEFTHDPEFAVVQFCEVAVVEQAFGLPPLPPECSTERASHRLRHARTRPRILAGSGVRRLLHLVDPLQARAARAALAGEGRAWPPRRGEGRSAVAVRRRSESDLAKV